MPQDTPVPEPAPDAVPAADPIPAPEAEPAADAVPVPVAEAQPAPVAEPEPVPRRRRRTTVLIAAAAVLGVLAGAGTGYGIQYDREPTPLAPLAGEMPAQPKGAAPDAPALPASQDRAAIYDGNLLDLLVPLPKGAEDAERVWVPLSAYVAEFDDPAGAFEAFAANGFRRSVRTDWTAANGTYVEIQMTQFQDEGTAYASSRFSAWASSVGADPAYGPSADIAGTTHVYAWPSGKSFDQGDGSTQYSGRGLAQVGNIIIEIFMDEAHPVKTSDILPVINEQLERL